MKKTLSICLGIFFTLALTFVFLFTTLDTSGSAATSGYYTYSVSNGEATITGVVSTSISGDITIPSTLGGYPVISIGDYAFCNCSSLTSIAISDSVTSIDNYAFSSCSSLTSIAIPDSVTSIGDYAFCNCSSLTSIIIPDSVTSIGGAAFSRCYALTSIAIPKGVTTIGDYAFSDCSSLTSVTIPDSVTSIGYNAFEYCSSLASLTIPDSVTSIGGNAFGWCSSLVSVYISDMKAWCEIEFYGTSSNPLFYADTLYLNGEKVTDLVLPKGTTKISNCAFYGCGSLTSVTIPDSVTSIGFYAFSGCSSLASVYISDLKAWCEIEFYETTSNPLYYADTQYLNRGKVTALDIPEGTTKISDYAFYDYDSLTSVTIPDSVTSIGDRAFYGCTELKTIYYYGTLEELKEIEISYGNTELTSATWHHNFCGNNKHSFSSECDTLCNICFVSRTVWGAHSFADNEQFCQHCDAPRYVSIAFSNYHDKAYIADCDENASGEIIIPKSYDGFPLTSIGDYAFSDCSSLTSVTIPNSVTSIGSNAFSWCRNLTSVTIPDSVTSIGSRAFAECSSLTSIIIPDSVTSIGGAAFSGCYALTSIAIPKGVTTIGDYAFSDCSSLTSVTIPDSVTSIGYKAFYYCSSLTSITIPNSVTTIKSNAFNGCTITDIWYTGSAEDRNLIVRESGNDALLSATWHFIDNACDSTCNACDATRTTKHVYDNAEDLICNECGYERPPYTPGDLDGVEGVGLNDAIYLLYYVNFPANYAVNQPVDYNGDSKEDLNDAIYLLYHVNFPEKYPLN